MTPAEWEHRVQVEPYGVASSGERVDRVRLANSLLRVELVTYGARVSSVLTRDRAGAWGEVTLGLADLAAYEQDRDFFGACVGRFANRIAGGSFSLDGIRYDLPTNEGNTTLHGGPEGFDHKIWGFEPDPTTTSVRMHRVSEDGEMGFPGRLDVSVTYRLDDSDLALDYEARTSAPTLVNLTNHAYFNLGGSGSVEGQTIVVDADSFLPVDHALIPTGLLQSVDGTPFDLRRPVRLSERIRAADEQVRIARGFDHTWVLGAWSGDQPRRVVRVEDEGSGRTLELSTDRPGVQVYTGNFLDGTVVGRDGTSYRQGDALCLEPQTFPDSPHHQHFPSALLRPGDIYRARDRYRLGAESRPSRD